MLHIYDYILVFLIPVLMVLILIILLAMVVVVVMCLPLVVMGWVNSGRAPWGNKGVLQAVWVRF